MSETPLDQILNEEPTEEIIEEAPEETPERPRDEHGRFKSKEETGEEEAAPAQEAEPESVTPTQEEQRVPIAALKDERQKRQELERQLSEVHNYLAQLQAPQQQQQQIPDMFEDPDGFKAHLAEQIRAQLTQELQPAIQHGQTLTRAEVSEMLARQKYEDYDATVEVFKEAMATNPFLLTQLQQAPDPATFAYNAGKQWQQAKSFGTEAPISREQIEAEIRDKIMAELNLRPTAPSTIAGERSVGTRTGPAWTGPTPLGQILGS
jgi:hypothetical protein